MIYTPNIKKALNIAYNKHNNQFDKGNTPYIFHPIHVAEQMDDENSIIVALLHDVIEDTNTSLEEIKKNGFNDEIIEALNLLTHKDNLDYFEYIKKISNNKLARKVKIADIKHNMDLTRLNEVTHEDKNRYEKYKKCLEYLEKKDM